MKKIFNLTFCMVFLLGAVSCTELLDPAQRQVKQELPEGSTLTMCFNVSSEISTKAAMANDPTIESIHVFIFDEEGTLLQVRPAKLGTTVSKNYNSSSLDLQTMVSSWKIDNVMMSAEPRILHFVANLPKVLGPDNQPIVHEDGTYEYDIPLAGSETSIFQSLALTAPQASYWQRVELLDILPYQYQGQKIYSYVDNDGTLVPNASVPNASDAVYNNDKECWEYTDHHGYTVTIEDYIDHSGDKILDGTGYYYVPDEDSPLYNMIPLVRNFARLQFTNNWSKFTLRKIALGNTPKSGLVAPYSTTGFESTYTDLVSQPAGTKPNVANLTGYHPLLSGDGIDTDCPTVFTSVTGTVNAATLFIYERDIPNASVPATCVLIGGVLSGAAANEKDSEGLTWFKIEITDVNGAYFPFYRDFTYPMTLSSIAESATRYNSAGAAWAALPVGDISNSPETATLTQITDGDGLILWVSYVDYPDLSGDRAVPLLYTFFRESENEGVTSVDYYPDNVTFTRQKKANSTLGWATTENVVKKGAITQNGANSAYWDKRPSDDYTWYLAEVTLNPKNPDATLQSNIHVEGHITSPYTKTLSRDVTYTVMGQQKLELTTSALSADASGNTVSLSVKLPDTFGSSVFPLTLKIEAEDNNLTPTDNLTVETGKSAFRNSNTYYFLKTISYSEYQSLASASPSYTFTCNFKTTKSTGKTPVTNIRVTEKMKEGETRESWFKGGNDATVALKVGSSSSN
jgi:hypothetical protein